MRDAAKATLARTLSSQGTTGATLVGAQTLPIAQAEDLLGSTSEVGSSLARIEPGPATRRISLPVGSGVAAIAPAHSPGVATSGAGRAASDRIGAQTLGLEEDNAFGSLQTLDLASAPKWSEAPAEAPITLPISPPLRSAPLAPLPRVSLPPSARPVSAERTLPVEAGSGASPDEPQRTPQAVWIAVAVAAMMVIAAVIVVVLRR